MKRSGVRLSVCPIIRPPTTKDKMYASFTVWI